MEPLISVIIPLYNAEDYLRQCVNSVLEQTYTNLEIILVDDGSTDASGMICAQYAETDSRVLVIHKENGGVSSARNAGLAQARGEYICFVDSDDFVANNLCETAMNALQRERADIVVFGITLTDEKGTAFGSIESKPGKFTDKTELLTLLLENRLQNYLCDKIFSRHIFDGITFPDGYIWEDMGTTYKLLLQADGVYSIPEKLYYYRQRENSIIHNISAKALRDIFTMQKRRYEDLLKTYPDVAVLALPLAADSALRLYDRSLWEDVGQKARAEAEDFLARNNAELLSRTKNPALKRYYQNKALYSRMRILRHRVGRIVKSAYKRMHRPR